MRVPDDFSVVAIISVPPQFAEMLSPALSGIDWPAFEAGKLAAEMLIARLAGGEQTPTQILIANELIAAPEHRPRTGCQHRAAPACGRPRATRSYGLARGGVATAQARSSACSDLVLASAAPPSGSKK